MPLLSKSLPNYSGKFGVGAVDVEIPVENERYIGKAVFKHNDEAALKVGPGGSQNLLPKSAGLEQSVY